MERAYGYTRVPTTGAPAPGATVTVYNMGTLVLATIFSDNLSTPKANPFVADSQGYFFFYAANGRYDVEFSGVAAGIPAPYTWGDIVLDDFISLNGLTAAAQLLATGTAGTDFNIVSATATHTFNLPNAGAAARGVVSTGAQSFAGAKTFLTPIAAGSGGTGLNAAAASNGQLLIGNGAGFSLGALGGTANQINVTSGAGTITLSTPQSIGTGNSPTFAGLTLSGITDKTLMYSNAGVITSLGALTDGQLVVGRTGFVPVLATLTAGTGISIVNGAGSITIAATGIGITSLNGSSVAAQTLSVGTTGTDFAIVDNVGAGTHAFNLPDASASARGVLTFGTQVIGGLKQYEIAPVWKPGAASTYAAKVVGIVSVNIVDVGNVGGGTDDLMTYAIPAGALNVDGKSVLRVRAWGLWGATANAKVLTAVFGATSITLANNSANNVSWSAEVIVVRNTATTQVMTGWAGGRSAGVWDGVQPAEAAPAETLANSITFKFQGAGTADNDLVQKGMIVEILEMP